MPKFEPFDWYAAPEFYDIIFDADTEREYALLQAIYDRYVTTKPRGKRVLEPACGSGRLLPPLIDAGFTCAGSDLEPGMVAYAKKRAPKAVITQASMQDFKVRGKFDLAFNLVSTFKYLQTDEEATAHLKGMAEVLKPGGVYVLGLHTTEYDHQSVTRERWVAERDGKHIVCNIQGWPADRKARTERVRSRMTVTNGGSAGETRYYESEWIFRTYDEGELRWLLASEPRLELLEVYGFDETEALAEPLGLESDRLDHLLVLRRR